MTEPLVVRSPRRVTLTALSVSVVVMLLGAIVGSLYLIHGDLRDIRCQAASHNALHAVDLKVQFANEAERVTYSKNLTRTLENIGTACN